MFSRGGLPRLARWVWHYARLVFAGSAIPYNIIAGLIAGFVATYFTYKFLPRPELTEPLILDDILPALGFALYRIVVPVLVTILVAGRTGAALASGIPGATLRVMPDVGHLSAAEDPGAFAATLERFLAAAARHA